MGTYDSEYGDGTTYGRGYGAQEASAVAAAVLVQTSYRWRNDDGSEAAATWRGALNTSVANYAGTVWRLRFLVQETGGSATTQAMQLQYRLGAGAWTNVTTTSDVVKAVVSTNLTDEGDTTQQLGAGTFVSPNAGVSEDGLTPAISFAGSDEVEVEFAVKLVSGDFSDGDTLEFRIAALDTYTEIATSTVDHLPRFAGVTWIHWNADTIDSGPVGSWIDVASGIEATNTADARPALTDGAVDFDGVDDYLEATGLALDMSGGVNFFVTQDTDVRGNLEGWLTAWRSSGSVSSPDIEAQHVASGDLWSFNVDRSVSLKVTQTSPTVDTKCLLAVRVDSAIDTAGAFRRDAVDVGTNQSTGTWAGVTNTIVTMRLGSGISGNLFDGKIWDLAIGYGATLTDTQLEEVERVLQDLRGL